MNSRKTVLHELKSRLFCWVPTDVTKIPLSPFYEQNRSKERII